MILLEKAKENFEIAEKSAEKEYYDVAISRLYYSMFQNLNLLQSKLKNESNKEVFNYIEEKSKTEDLILLISTNFIALMITVGFDRFGVFEESDETIKENKKKLVKLFL